MLKRFKKKALQSLTRRIGTDLSFAHCTLKETLLHLALINLSHEGSSKRSVNTVSSNSKSVKSPSPLKVLKLILSVDKFFVNLKGKKSCVIYMNHISLPYFK